MITGSISLLLIILDCFFEKRKIKSDENKKNKWNWNKKNDFFIINLCF